MTRETARETDSRRDNNKQQHTHAEYDTVHIHIWIHVTGCRTMDGRRDTADQSFLPHLSLSGVLSGCQGRVLWWDINTHRVVSTVCNTSRIEGSPVNQWMDGWPSPTISHHHTPHATHHTTTGQFMAYHHRPAHANNSLSIPHRWDLGRILSCSCGCGW